MPGYTSSEESEDSRRPPKQSPEKLGESKQKHKRTKSMTPQQSINRTWRRFSRHQFNNGPAIIPFDPVPPPVNTGRSNRLLSEDYGRAAAECRLKVEKIVKECKRVNMRYRDPDWDLDWDFKHEKGHCLNTLGQKKFELSDTSLLSSEDRVPKAVKRVHEIFENPTFMKNIHGGDVKQGNLSDCWLMAGLIALANIPASLKRICVAYNVDVGIYGFVFYRDGEWIYSIIDNKLYLKSPCWDSPSTQRNLLQQVGQENAEKVYRETYQTGSRALFFAQCKDQNETWVPLLQKAYAKAHGDYSSLASGWIGEALEDLTGGVTSELSTSDILDKDEFWRRELSKVNDQFFFGASTGYLENGYGERDGIAETHAYVVLEARTLKNGQRLVKLRNPWGDTRKGIWDGPWSDGSKEWTRDIQEELGHKFGSDSVFWISYQDLLRKFSHIDRTRLLQDADWRCCQRWVGVDVPWKAQYHERFHIKVTQSSPVILVISQLDGRYFNGLQGQYSFRLHFRLHSQENLDADSYIARSHGNYLMTRSVSAEIPTLLPGTYIVYVKVAGERDLSAEPVEEVVRRECLDRTENEKLLQVGYAHDFAHRKASALMDKAMKLRQGESFKKASESRRKERRRQWAKRHARRQATREQKKKDMEKYQRRHLESQSGVFNCQIRSQAKRSVEIKSGFDQVKAGTEKNRRRASSESNLSTPRSAVEYHSASQCPSDDEKKPTVADAVVSRNPSQLRNRLPWSRKYAFPLASPDSLRLTCQSHKFSTVARARLEESGSGKREDAEGKPSYVSAAESSASPVDDWEALYSSDDMTQQPRDDTLGNPSHVKQSPLEEGRLRYLQNASSSDDERYDSEEEKMPAPWNATCTIGIRVYSKDEDLLLLTVEDGVLLEQVRMKRSR
ncbi:Calpain catalytic domain-containing protein [Fusarium sp. LHS14.1]|nr:Calpain catalytic domain-containing protein [Fusarium sp. LHS14.1]